MHSDTREQVDKHLFYTGERVTFVIRPMTAAMVYSEEYDVDGLHIYGVTFVDGDDLIKSGKFYGFELERVD